jgi:hypothetical protein
MAAAFARENINMVNMMLVRIKAIEVAMRKAEELKASDLLPEDQQASFEEDQQERQEQLDAAREELRKFKADNGLA